MATKQLLLASAFMVLFPVSINSLFFHMSHRNIKCYNVEVPFDTLVIGKFRVEPWNEGLGEFSSNAYGQGLRVEVKDRDSRPVLSKLYGGEGRFAFTSHTPGEHSICLSSNTTAPDLIFETTPTTIMDNSWSNNENSRNRRPPHRLIAPPLKTAEGELRVHLKIRIGGFAIDYDVVKEKEKLTSVQLRIRKLLDLADQIVKEQEYQRIREDRFRQTSDSTNSRVFWFALLHSLILVGMGYWQMSNLKMFFIMKKLV